jgi:hypothetical protein
MSKTTSLEGVSFPSAVDDEGRSASPADGHPLAARPPDDDEQQSPHERTASEEIRYCHHEASHALLMRFVGGVADAKRR